jgi:hypothetical protein
MYDRSIARSDGRKPGAYNAAKTHCKQGHPFDEANTYWNPDGSGRRQCKECVRINRQRSRQRKREREAALVS